LLALNIRTGSDVSDLVIHTLPAIDWYISAGLLWSSSVGPAGKVPFDKVAAEFTRRRREDAHAIVNLNTTKELFPRGYLGLMQMLLLTTLHKLAPKFFKPTSFNQLWSDMPFAQIKLQKRMEDRFFYGLLFGLGFLVLSGILFLLGVRTPPPNPKPTFWAPDVENKQCFHDDVDCYDIWQTQIHVITQTCFSYESSIWKALITT
jgi:hypothetical protein